MGTEVADAWNRAQLLAGLDRDAVHLRPGSARLGQPVHQKVSLLEVRQQRLSKLRVNQDAGQRKGANRGIRRARFEDDLREQRVVAALAASV